MITRWESPISRETTTVIIGTNAKGIFLYNNPTEKSSSLLKVNFSLLPVLEPGGKIVVKDLGDASLCLVE